MSLKLTSVAAVSLGLAFTMVCLTDSARAQFYEFNFPGNTSFDGWDSLDVYTYSGFGSFPGLASWPGAALSMQTGSGDAALWKISNGVGGGPFMATSSLYFGSYIQNPNDFGGTLSITDETPVAGVRTIVLQVFFGEAVGYDFYFPEGFPVLFLNGSDEGIKPSTTRLLNKEWVGEFESPDTGMEPLYNNTWAFVWSLPEDAEVTSFAINFSGVTHSQVYRLQLDQTSANLPDLFSSNLALLSHESPTFDGSETQMICQLHAVSPSLAAYATSTPEVLVEFTDDLTAGPWQSAGIYPVDEAGDVSVTLAENGDHRTAWARQMFFRASFVPPVF